MSGFEPFVDGTLAIHCAVFDELEKAHQAASNQLAQLTRVKPDKDGVVRGAGVDPASIPAVVAVVDALGLLLRQAEKNLVAAWRPHPLAPFARAVKGFGPKQTPRLVAALGDPVWNDRDARVRTFGELVKWAGLAPGRYTAFNHEVRMRAYLIAAQSLKTNDARCRPPAAPKGLAALPWSHVAGCGCSPFRIVYDARRAHTAVTRPEWTPKHSHLDGLRVGSRAVLRALFDESRRLHGLEAPDVAA